MLTKADVVSRILGGRSWRPVTRSAEAYAPSNIALSKYWGKRNAELNLPLTSSVSLSLGAMGSSVSIQPRDDGRGDRVTLNGAALASDSAFSRRLFGFIDLFRGRGGGTLDVQAVNTIPTAAGFASSASGFAAVITAIDRLMGWGLTPCELSVLARLGSGSAARSVFTGLVEWHAGTDPDGMDSFAEPLEDQWPELRMGLLVVSDVQKKIGSREGMGHTLATSPLFGAWPATAEQDLAGIKDAVRARDFDRLGRTVEGNALAMHATMIAARPPLLYWEPGTIAMLRRVWDAREGGLSLYATMDAGPNVKILMLAGEQQHVTATFPEIMIADPTVCP